MVKYVLKAILVVFLFPSSVFATPPRVMDSIDTVVGATQTHLYVLRDITDNVGSHFKELRD